MMYDIKGAGSIKTMVDEFYAKVQLDELLGPVFAETIKNNWQPHLEKMYTFWNAVLFGVPGFRGNPFAKHAPLLINENHFSRWLNLFNQTIDALFIGPVAVDAKNRAALMAVMFQSKLANMKGGADKVIV